MKMTTKKWYWRDGSAVKGACCSYKGPRFSCWYPHGGSQASVTLVPMDMMPSSDLHKSQDTHMVYIHPCRQTFMHIRIK